MSHPSDPLPISARASLSLDRPCAITMWDFSWLERRWPGAGYEDWDRALDELAERGYDAVRIDAYPHLHAIDAEIIAAACNRGLMVGPYQSFNNWHVQPDAVAAPEDKISRVR